MSIITITKEESFRRNVLWIIFGGINSFLIGLAIADSKWLFISGIIIPLILYLSLKKPVIFPFGAYVLLLPFDDILAITGNSKGATLTKLLGLLTILVLSLKGLFEHKLKKLPTVSIWWIIFIIYCALSLMWAIQPDLGISRIPTAIGLLFVYLLSATYKFTKEDQIIIKSLILCGGAVGSLVIIYNFINANTLDATNLRTTLAFAEREVGLNQASFNLLIPISLCIAIILEHRSQVKKIFFIVLLSVILFADFLTGSRGGMIGVLVIILTYLKHLKKRSTPLVIAFAIGSMLVIFLPEYFIERIGESVQDRGAGRLDIWTVGWKMLERYWLIGAGLDNFSLAYSEFASYAPTFRGLSRASHNIFLCFLVELGIVGFSFLIVGIIKHYQAINVRHVENQGTQIMLKAAFLGVIVSSLFLDTMWSKTFWLLWMLIMIHRSRQG